MHYKTPKQGWFNRAMSALLAAILVVGLVPANLIMPASAAGTEPPATAKLATAHYPYKKGGGEIDVKNYQSTFSKLGTCWFHTFELNINGTNTLGFCADHTKQMKTAYIGQEWKNPEPVDRNAHPVMCAFLDLFYDRYQTSVQIDKDYPDESEAQKLEREPYYYNQYARDFYNATYQAIVWMELGGAFAGYDITDPVDRVRIEKMVAKEMGRVASRLDSSKTEQGWVDHYAEKTVKWILAAYFNETIDGQAAHKSPKLDYYIYHHSDSSKQPILTAIPPEEDDVDEQGVYITLDKVDENGNTLSGASFEVYLDSSCTQKVSGKGFMTGATQGQAYGPFGWPGTETIKTLYLKETKAPSGHTLGAMEGRILSVVVDSTINDESNPAKVLGGPFENKLPDEPTPTPGVLKKVDAKTGRGVGPATFHIEGQAHIDNDHRPDAQPVHPEQVSMDVVSDANGNFDLQWLIPGEDNYIPVGTYTVTEKIPPEGYEKTDESKTLVLEITEDGTAVSNGPLIFENNPLHRIELIKVDESGNGLPGAIFEVRRNGLLLGSYETGADGKIDLSGDNGEGLLSGYYELVETKAPEGYLLPYRRVHTIMIDAEQTEPTTHVISVANYRYPEIRIVKKDADGTKFLPGAVFEVKIDGRDFGRIPTGDGGAIVIDYATYGRFLGDGDPEGLNKTHTVMVREVEPPEGYLLDDPNWHEAEIVPGQTLAPFTFTDTKYPEIQILKRDRETGEPLKNAQFKIDIDAGASFSLTKSTDEEGLIHITYDDYKRFIGDIVWDKGWTVTVTETIMPDKYNKDKQPESGDYTITKQLLPGESLLEFEFVDTHYRDVMVIKRDSSNTWRLEGAVFKLESISLEDPAAGSTISVRRRPMRMASSFSKTFPTARTVSQRSRPPQAMSSLTPILRPLRLLP